MQLREEIFQSINFLRYNPWDQGTRYEGDRDENALPDFIVNVSFLQKFVNVACLEIFLFSHSVSFVLSLNMVQMASMGIQ